MSHLVYLVMVIAAFFVGYAPEIIVAFIAAVAAACIALNVRSRIEDEGWDASGTQMAVAHGAMLTVMGMMVLGGGSFLVKAVIAITAVPAIWYDGGNLWRKISSLF